MEKLYIKDWTFYFNHFSIAKKLNHRNWEKKKVYIHFLVLWDLLSKRFFEITKLQFSYRKRYLLRHRGVLPAPATTSTDIQSSITRSIQKSPKKYSAN